MAAVTNVRQRFTVEGARRAIFYKCTVNNSGDTLKTPLKKVDYVDGVSTTTQPIGITVSGGTLTFQVTTVPDTVFVDLVGL